MPLGVSPYRLRFKLNEAPITDLSKSFSWFLRLNIGFAASSFIMHIVAKLPNEILPTCRMKSCQLADFEVMTQDRPCILKDVN